MKIFISAIFSLVLMAKSCKSDSSAEPGETVLGVDASLFLSDAISVTLVDCILSDGSSAECYQIVSNGLASDHEMGPWCPTTITDDATAGGIWLENGNVYDVDGEFVKNMATFYNDNTWKMYDADGKIYKTETLEDCNNAANPNVGAEYANFCVECLPSYISNINQTYLIPKTPKLTSETTLFGAAGGPPDGGAGGPPPGGDMGGGPPPDAIGGLSARGIAFNGIPFDAPAPTDAILGAYTLAPFDDAGGHINLNAGYHYHAAMGKTTKFNQPDGHAAMIGYAMDGHGIYEQLNEDGTEPTDLDECRGHTDTTRGYHYHVSSPGTNNFFNCLKGAYVN
ncbi:YHYH protein [uncultured Arcticibacterium sp.]|uniref:YHYH protein n=1 Tax=uncultured Arcticibacterium sp. TaxID=2173042 RepID=UPI0030F91330